MLSITQIEILKNIKDQASYFLKHAGEFFPFATVVDKDHQLKPLSVYFGVEHPTSQAVFEQLETGILKGINAGNYISAAIGLDVIMKNENQKEERQRNE